MALTQLNDAELEESFDRSSGPGGQNVNKTSTKVTLRHLPTGIFVTVQDTRSQFQNRQLARERLLQALNDRAREEQARRKQALEKKRRQTRSRPRKVKTRMLEAKRRRGDIKRQRSTKHFD